MSAVRYDDWEIASRHREIVAGVMPRGNRVPQLVRQIEGFENNRITRELKQGVFLMPLDHRIEMTFSDRHDVDYLSLMVFAKDTTTRNQASAPESMVLMKSLRPLFASRRVMDLPGELYSNCSKVAYDVDDDAPRRWEILVVRFISKFREAR